MCQHQPYLYIYKINHYTKKESCEIHEVNRLFPPLIITLVAKYKLIMTASSIACVVPNDVENSWKRLILPLSGLAIIIPIALHMAQKVN